MFKIEQRIIKGKLSKYYSFRGTYKNDIGQSKTFSWICTFQTDKKLAKQFVDNFENKLKQTNLTHAKIKYKTLAELKKDDDINPPSLKTKSMIDRTVKFLGNYYVQDITNKIIQKEAFKCYSLDERLRKSAWSDLKEHEQEKKSSRNNSINRAFIIGVDRAKMRLYDVEQTAQKIVDSNQETKDKLESPSGPQPADAYDKFSGFKV